MLFLWARGRVRAPLPRPDEPGALHFSRARWPAGVGLCYTSWRASPTARRLSSDTEGESINTLRTSVSGILISCLVAAGSAVVITVIIAIVDIYVSGHNLEPTHWPVIKEWLFRGSLIVLFLTTLFVSLTVTSARS